jgi:hypothetical protein
VRRSGAAPQAARALYLLAKASGDRGLLDDAVYYNRQLARDFGAIKVDGKRTGTEVLEELQKDKRYLPYLEQVEE